MSTHPGRAAFGPFPFWQFSGPSAEPEELPGARILNKEKGAGLALGFWGWRRRVGAPCVPRETCRHHRGPTPSLRGTETETVHDSTLVLAPSAYVSAAAALHSQCSVSSGASRIPRWCVCLSAAPRACGASVSVCRLYGRRRESHTFRTWVQPGRRDLRASRLKKPGGSTSSSSR